MKRRAIFFPDTVPALPVIPSLVQVFDEVVHCRAVENDDSPFLPEDTSCREELMRICREHVPAPLGEDRDRFLRLVRELRENGGEYAGRMAGVTLADMQPGGRTAGETGSAILARLVTGQGGEGREVQRKNLLWQARIVLKLAEQYDEEQRALSRAINAIEQRERELFSGLAADADENPFSLTGRLSSSSGDWDRMQRLRRKAWSRLLAFGEAPLPGGVFITTDGEALELLLDTQERETGLRPQVGATFLLPAAGEKGVEKLFEGADQLRGEVSTGNDGMPAPSGSWEQRLDEFFPTPRFGRCRLDLYPFPGARARHLFLETFGREKGFDMEIADEAPRDLTIGLLGGV